MTGWENSRVATGGGWGGEMCSDEKTFPAAWIPSYMGGVVIISFIVSPPSYPWPLVKVRPLPSILSRKMQPGKVWASSRGDVLSPDAS